MGQFCEIQGEKKVVRRFLHLITTTITKGLFLLVTIAFGTGYSVARYIFLLALLTR